MRHGFGFLTLIKLRVDPVKLLHLLQKGIMRGEKKSQCVKLDIFEAAEGRKNLPSARLWVPSYHRHQKKRAGQSDITLDEQNTDRRWQERSLQGGFTRHKRFYSPPATAQSPSRPSVSKHWLSDRCVLRISFSGMSIRSLGRFPSLRVVQILTFKSKEYCLAFSKLSRSHVNLKGAITSDDIPSADKFNIISLEEV